MTGYKNRHCRYAQVFTTHPRYRMTGQIWNWLDMSTNKGGTAIIRPLQYVEGVFYSIGNHIKGKDKERSLMTELKEDEEQKRVCKGGNDE